jgi:hypothetical protein
MKYVFLVAFQKANKNLIKVKKLDGAEVWATTTEATYAYVKANCTKDREYEMQTEEKNGQMHIKQVGDGPAPVVAPKTEGASTVANCIECGKVLKDAKYKKCYNCNKKAADAPAPVATTTAEAKPYTPYVKDDATKRSIEKQSMMKSAADAVATAMQGQIGDVDTLGDMIIKLYEKLYSKLIV